MNAQLIRKRMDRANQLLQQMEQIEAELAQLFGGDVVNNGKPAAALDTPAAKTSGKRGGKRTMSPEGRARIAAATRARWAKIKGGANSAAATSASPVKAKKKRTMSPETKAKMAAAQKKRWAKLRSGK